MRLVSGVVVKLRYISKLDLTAGQWSPHMTQAHIMLLLYADGARCLSHAVALKHWATKAHSEELQDLAADGTGTCACSKLYCCKVHAGVFVSLVLWPVIWCLGQRIEQKSRRTYSCLYQVPTYKVCMVLEQTSTIKSACPS